MFISIDLPSDVLAALDAAIAARIAVREPPSARQKREPKHRPLTQKERGKAALIAQKEGAAAANAWIASTTRLDQDGEDEAPRRVGRPRDFPSRRLLIEEALRQVYMQKKEG